MYSLYIDSIIIPQTFILRKFISSISDLTIDEKFNQFNPKAIINDCQYFYELKDFTYKNPNFLPDYLKRQINALHENNNIPPLNEEHNNNNNISSPVNANNENNININSINLNLDDNVAQNNLNNNNLINIHEGSLENFNRRKFTSLTIYI